MKVGGFKAGHCYYKPSDAATQQEPSGVSSGVSQDDFDRAGQTILSGLLAVFDTESRPGLNKTLRPRLDKCTVLTDMCLQAEAQTETRAVSEMPGQ